MTTASTRASGPHLSRHLVVCFGLAFGAIGCQSPTPASAPIIELSRIGIEAEFGIEGGNDLSVLRRPVGAAFLGDEVVVLDLSTPWIRVFDRRGRFLQALVRSGSGPGEIRFPLGLAATKDGQILVAESRGVTRFDRDGNPTLRVSSGGEYMLRGAIQGCGGQVLVLAREVGISNDVPGLLLRARSDGSLGDTVAQLEPLRPPDSRRRRPSYLQTDGEGVLLYTEEADPHRLLEVQCEGRILKELEIGPLGPPERVVPGYRAGTIGVKGEEPPYPGGLVKVGDTILWATLALDTLAHGVLDSVTVVVALDGTPPKRTVTLAGWLQLFASDSQGMVLLGMADALYPKVALVDGNALLSSMRTSEEWRSENQE